MTEWMITTAVGTGEKGFAGDGGPATEAQLNGPFDVAFDGAGNLYFSDTFNHRIRCVEAVTGIISTIAGNGDAGYSGDGGSATRARSTSPTGCRRSRRQRLHRRPAKPPRALHRRRLRRYHDAGRHRRGRLRSGHAARPHARASPSRTALPLDPDDRRLYIADVADHRVRVVDLASGIIGTFAGTGMAEHGGDGAPARDAGVSARARSNSRPTAPSISSSARAAACAPSIPPPA